MLRSIKVTTTATDEDILLNTNVQKRICERLGIADSDYSKALNGNGIKMDLTISFSATNKISINNGLFDDLFEDSIYTLGMKTPIKSVKIKTPATFFVLIDVD